MTATAPRSAATLRKKGEGRKNDNELGFWDSAAIWGFDPTTSAGGVGSRWTARIRRTEFGLGGMEKSRPRPRLWPRTRECCAAELAVGRLHGWAEGEPDAHGLGRGLLTPLGRVAGLLSAQHA
jgi:hypothetical protein